MIYIDNREYLIGDFIKDFLISVIGAILLIVLINLQFSVINHQKNIDEALASVQVFEDAYAVNEVENGQKLQGQLDHKLRPATPNMPVHLAIPAVNIETNIQPVGLALDGSVDVPVSPTGVGWFQLGPKPGEIGSAIIAGHYGQWQDGTNSVFNDLHKLIKGDVVYIKDDKGEVFSFIVKEIRVYDLESYDPVIFNKKDGAYLNIITCSGNWISSKKTFDKRLIVFTELLI